MTKKWFIKIRGKQQGPFTISELRKKPEITPETPCRQEAEEVWRPIGEIEELQEVFYDEDPSPDQESSSDDDLPLMEGDVLTAEFSPKNFLPWIIILLLLTMFIIYRMQWL